jgi:hypothetical protein
MLINFVRICCYYAMMMKKISQNLADAYSSIRNNLTIVLLKFSVANFRILPNLQQKTCLKFSLAYNK